MIVTDPWVVRLGVYVTEQLPKNRVQVVELKDPFPPGWPEKVTTPPGWAVLGTPSVSRTLAVQVVALPANTDAGAQLTETSVLRT